MVDVAQVFRNRIAPMKRIGVSGAIIYAGYPQSNETNRKLEGREKYITFSNLLANVSIIAAGVRYFLNLIAKAAWTAVPSDPNNPQAVEAAEFVNDVLQDMETPWPRVVRRTAMYRFYGFSIQEWIAKRRSDGRTGFLDVEPRPQPTIERWIDDDEGKIIGVIQRAPKSLREIPLPMSKLIYAVDDSLSDSPEGLGLFRHLVAPAERLKRYEQLEGWGYETDLRGIPVGRAPLSTLRDMEERGELTKTKVDEILNPMNAFIKGHVKNPELGILLDSSVYETQDESARPSSVQQWSIDLLEASSDSVQYVLQSIDRLNHEIARILSVDHLLLGSDGSGSLALARDKSHNFYLVVDSTLTELRATYERDLLTPLWEMNGFDKELMPTLQTEDVQFKDVEQITSALRDMSTAGAVIMPDDPVINAVRDLLGLPKTDEGLSSDPDAVLTTRTSNTEEVPNGAGSGDE